MDSIRQPWAPLEKATGSLGRLVVGAITNNFNVLQSIWNWVFICFRHHIIIIILLILISIAIFIMIIGNSSFWPRLIFHLFQQKQTKRQNASQISFSPEIIMVPSDAALWTTDNLDHFLMLCTLYILYFRISTIKLGKQSKPFLLLVIFLLSIFKQW